MTLEVEFPVGSHKYRAVRLSVFEQMDLASDYRDVLIALAMMKQQRPAALSDADYGKAVEFIMTAKANLPIEIRRRVMNNCLRNVTRYNTGWSPVLAADDVLAFADMELPVVCQIMYKVFEHNKLLDFFSDSPSGSTPGTTGSDGQASGAAKTG